MRVPGKETEEKRSRASPLKEEPWRGHRGGGTIMKRNVTRVKIRRGKEAKANDDINRNV